MNYSAGYCWTFLDNAKSLVIDTHVLFPHAYTIYNYINIFFRCIKHISMLHLL